MQIKELLRGVEVLAWHCDPETEITGVCCDSRKAVFGFAFIASRRVGTDGHDYIDAARETGASLIVSQRDLPDCASVQVADGNAALAQICANFYGNPADRMQIIGITGTKGKSTTAFNLKHILTQSGAKVGLIGTVWYMAGDEILCDSKNSTPEAPLLHETLAEMAARGCTHVVMEVSSHSLDVGRVGGIRFASAIFTNLSQDHLDYHITMENYLAAKAKIFSAADCGALNLDDAAAAGLFPNLPCRATGFGLKNPAAAVRAEEISYAEDVGVSFTAVRGEERYRVRLTSAGLFMIYNALAAITAALDLGVSFADACAAMCTAPAVPGRLQHVDAGQPFRVLVDYAHTPDSVRQISETAREFTPGRLISLFGCGGNRDRTKRPLMGEAAARYADLLIVTTDNPRFEEPDNIIADILPGIDQDACSTEVIPDRRAAIARAVSLAGPGDTVLIMGKGHETYQEVRGVRSHFDDAEEVLDALNRGGYHA